MSRSPWIARALEMALGEAGFVTLRARDPAAAVDLCAGSIDAIIVDIRTTADQITGPAADPASAIRTIADAPACGLLPLLVLVHDTLSARELSALYDAGVWGVVPFPFGAPAWTDQLRSWVRVSRASRRGLDAGLLDLQSGVYNARGLERRATEIEAAMRRAGGPIACAVFAFAGTAPPETPAAAALADAPLADAPLADAPLADAPLADAPLADAPMARHVGDACRRLGRGSDVFGRIGDADFAVIAPGADAAGIRHLVDRVAGALAADGPAGRMTRMGVCAVPDAASATLTVPDMLAHAASRA